MKRVACSFLVALVCLGAVSGCAVDVGDGEPQPLGEEEVVSSSEELYGCGPDVERWCGAGGRIWAMTYNGCFRLVQQCNYACWSNNTMVCFPYGSEVECAFGSWAYCVTP